MKATISELWDTGREIISFDNSEFDRPFDISDLKQCENVLIGKKDKFLGTEVMIGNDLYYAKHVRVKNRYMDFYGVEVFR